MEYKFKDEEHKKFFKKLVAETNSDKDPYRKALFYTLGLTEETRNNINSLYDFNGNCIDFDGLHGEWQTGTSMKICRLAFNLYNGSYGQHGDTESPEDYTPYGLFDCGLIEYMFEAIRIRYEEYTWLPY